MAHLATPPLRRFDISTQTDSSFRIFASTSRSSIRIRIASVRYDRGQSSPEQSQRHAPTMPSQWSREKDQLVAIRLPVPSLKIPAAFPSCTIAIHAIQRQGRLYTATFNLLMSKTHNIDIGQADAPARQCLPVRAMWTADRMLRYVILQV